MRPNVSHFGAAALAAGVLVAASVGCGNDSDGAAAVAPAKTEIGRVDPRLVASGSPGKAVVELWTRIQAGAVPLAVIAYDPLVRERVGVGPLAGAVGQQQSAIAGLVPKVAKAEDTSLGSLITVKTRRTDGTVSEYTFLVRRRGGRWQVVYDSLMAEAIPSFVATQGRAPSAKPRASDVRAGANAGERFRTALFTITGRVVPDQTADTE